MSTIKIKNALVSVSDKTDLPLLAQALVAAGAVIYSTGGTRKALEQAGFKVRDVSDYTGFPEMMDGRLKTLHPRIFGGLLCRHDRTDDMQALDEHEIVKFELAVVNLYPFEQTIARPGVSEAEAIEQIDIGGPSLVRAAAKNHAFAAIATDPSQYDELIRAISSAGGTTLEQRRRLAAAAFEKTAQYDRAIADYFARDELARDEATANAAGPPNDSPLPPSIRLSYPRRVALRYGENPHQAAALYVADDPPAGSLVAARQLHGKELSYNNYVDLESAWEIARSLPDRAAAVIKHTNPCGAASGETLADAMQKALDGDPVSAFGSVIGVNCALDGAAALLLAQPDRFVEAIVAPSFSSEAFEILTTRPKWKANVRLIEAGRREDRADDWQYRFLDGGVLLQQADPLFDVEDSWKVTTDEHPTDQQLADLRFAWGAVRSVKSNAIVLSKNRALCGVGAGQMSRVDSVEIAIRKAADRAAGCVLASDAFFPFADSIHAAAAAGVVAIIQPGGSRRDDEVIAACNERRLPMIFTDRRHFKH